VFGLGRFGYAIAKELSQSGAEVLAVDLDESVVNAAAKEIPLCKCADVTDPEVLSRLGIANFDTVIIAMADNLEASVLAITLCKEAGVKNVIVKCANPLHQRMLLKIGADEVTFPEHESGVRLAKNLLSAGFVDIAALSDEVSVIELEVKDEWAGKTLIELSLRRKYGINVVGIRKEDKLMINIDPEMLLRKEMTLVVIASKQSLKKLV
jgi:trk system potassium uptake protein TrkA